jgi:hypothetical protein
LLEAGISARSPAPVAALRYLLVQFHTKTEEEMQMHKLTVAVALMLLASTAAMTQEKKPPASPRQTSNYTFADGKKITVDYGAPSVRGRTIMGGLVPYGKVWRTGANEATGFVTDTDLMIGDTKVPAGKYTLFTLPGENAWQLIINKQTGQWGLKYDETQDLARISMKVGKMGAPVEMMKISFDGSGGTATSMNIEWENTKLSVPIKEVK